MANLSNYFLPPCNDMPHNKHIASRQLSMVRFISQCTAKPNLKLTDAFLEKMGQLFKCRLRVFISSAIIKYIWNPTDVLHV